MIAAVGIMVGIVGMHLTHPIEFAMQTNIVGIVVLSLCMYIYIYMMLYIYIMYIL